jgi:hypothetical protein
MGSHLLDVLGKLASAPEVETLLTRIADEKVVLTQKDFKTVSYHSSQTHGLSLQFEQAQSSWTCRAVDVYNDNAVKGWRAFAALPLQVELQGQDD